MNPGKYKHRITIEHQVITKDPDYGTDVIITWAPLATRIAAQVQDVLPSKSETAQQGLQLATNPARVRIRYRPGITSAMRIVVHGAAPRTLQIVAGPAELGNRTEIEFMAQQYSTDPQAS